MFMKILGRLKFYGEMINLTVESLYWWERHVPTKDMEPSQNLALPAAPAPIPVRRVPPKVGTAPRHVFTDKAQYLVHDLEGGETLLEEISQGRVVTTTVHRKVSDEVIREIIELAVPISIRKEAGIRQPVAQAEMPKAPVRKPMAVRVQKRIVGPVSAATAA
jgi:hypothetical protein